jgi:hypothetical protein
MKLQQRAVPYLPEGDPDLFVHDTRDSLEGREQGCIRA